MRVHHVISTDDMRDTCPYCGRSAEPGRWRSTFDTSNIHYKDLKCSCGKRISIKVPFIGDGNDSWNKNLDKRIEEEVDSESQKK